MAKVGNKGLLQNARSGLKAGPKGRDAAAVRARERLAKRSRRHRFFKENKARITIAAVVFFLLLGLLFLTPYGPNLYRERITEKMFVSPGVLAPGITGELHSLGRFLGYTFRTDDAVATYNEIGVLYYGFKFTDYMADPTAAEDQRFEAERLVKRGERLGPPYAMDETNLPAVGMALYHTAEWARKYRPKQFALRLYQLYNTDFYEKHPDSCDPEVVKQSKAAEDKLIGRR